MDNLLTQYLIVGQSGRLGSAIIENLKLEIKPQNVFGISSQNVVNFLQTEKTINNSSEYSNIEILWCSGSARARSDYETCHLDLKKIIMFVNFMKTYLTKSKCRITYISSGGTVYGSSAGLVNESSPVNPQTYYAQMKLDSELQLKKLSFETTIQISVLRIANMYGVPQPEKLNGVVETLINSALEKNLLNLTANKISRKQYGTYVDYAKQILVLLSKQSSSDAFLLRNMYSNHIYSISELMRKVESHFQTQIRLIDKLENSSEVIDETVILSNVEGFVVNDFKWKSMEEFLTSRYPLS